VGPHHEQPEMSAVAVVLTILHEGGKCGGNGYKVSGGLHGVGGSVVNALSTRVEVEIDRDVRRYSMSFGNGGKIVDELRAGGDSSENDTGTTVCFWPDGSIVDDVRFRAQGMCGRLRLMAFVHRDLEIECRDLRWYGTCGHRKRLPQSRGPDPHIIEDASVESEANRRDDMVLRAVAHSQQLIYDLPAVAERH